MNKMQAPPAHSLDYFRTLATRSDNSAFLESEQEKLAEAIRIREVEQAFLELFSKGMMNGTVHTCIGQEFSAVAIAGMLETQDWVTSNHRCHGHFISKTGQWRALIDELMGLKSGVCQGVGSSQHLFAEGFLSNGPQGALLPVGAGIALHFKKQQQKNLVASYIGEGTLGEGNVYETFNLASLWSLPQLFVCENNGYSQSTPQPNGVAGSITARAEAFGIRTFEANTWDLIDLINTAKEAINFVRNESCPAFLQLRTYRLKAHSKGDDDRDSKEIAFFEEWDPLNRLLSESEALRKTQQKICEEIQAHIESVDKTVLTSAEYAHDQLPRKSSARLQPVTNERIRMIQALNKGMDQALSAGAVLIGEDIVDPYGGAFKATMGLSTQYPDQVFSSPISEVGIAGMGVGLAMMDREAYVEIMFGDFMTNVVDQVINNMSKFYHMYAFQTSVPVRIRTPMGGKRGYGPTHSQSLEKHFLGIDNLLVLSFTSLEDPREAMQALRDYPGPALIVESKTDYGQILWQGNDDVSLKKQGGEFGSLVLSPTRRKPNLTVVAYSGTAREIADKISHLFVETDYVIELVVPIKLHPLDMAPILRSAEKTGQLLVVEDGSTPYGFGSEVLANVAQSKLPINASRLGAAPVPIPSPLELERELLPTYESLLRYLSDLRGLNVEGTS
ncbi:MAG: thiamine pyrophosphate-dependent enzyme [Pseudomonadota bacterium]